MVFIQDVASSRCALSLLRLSFSSSSSSSSSSFTNLRMNYIDNNLSLRLVVAHVSVTEWTTQLLFFSLKLAMGGILHVYQAWT